MSATPADIVAFVLADATLTGLVGTRLYPLTVPQHRTLPAMTYQVISTQRQHVFGAAAGIARTRIQFDCYSNNYVEVDLVAEALRKRLDAYQGAAGSGTIEAAMFDNERDIYEDSVDAYRRSIDYMIYLEDAA